MISPFPPELIERLDYCHISANQCNMLALPGVFAFQRRMHKRKSIFWLLCWGNDTDIDYLDFSRAIDKNFQCPCGRDGETETRKEHSCIYNSLNSLTKECLLKKGGTRRWCPCRGSQGFFWGYVWANIFVNNLKENSDGMLNMLTDVWICSRRILMITIIPCSYLT